MRTRLFAGMVVVTAMLTSSASAIESTIFPGVGIGKVKLGMTLTQVKKALGADYLVNRRQTIADTRATSGTAGTSATGW